MTTRQFTHPLGQTGQGTDANLPTAPDASETRQLLQRLGDFFFRFLDRYVQLTGPVTSAPQAPTVSWTPYSGNYREAMRWHSHRFRW